MTGHDHRLALGLDFGTESVRALLVDLNGQERASAASPYRHRQILSSLPGSDQPLPAAFALQHPQDWLDAAAKAVRSAMRQVKVDAGVVISLGVDFTSCTMLPTLRDGTPLSQLDAYRDQPHAWPKLWKHHGAQAATDRLNAVATKRDEQWLSRYGGIIGLEWLFPKMLEVMDASPDVYNAAELWMEAGDWFVWQLIGGGDVVPAEAMPRSTCQAGYKAMWSAATGYPSRDYLDAARPGFGGVLDKLPGSMTAPGERAGVLAPAMAKKFGLPTGLPISAAVIDAHAGVPGAGVPGPDTMVMVMGTSNCYMLNSREERRVPGVAGVVEHGILPGFFGYETGQAAVGDAFDWLRKLTGQKSFDQLNTDAAKLGPGAVDVQPANQPANDVRDHDASPLLCMDWMNGCRTPLMDGSLTGAFTGLKLAHRPAHLYRALLEASAFGLRWIVDLLIEGGVPVKRFVATGGLPHHNPLLVEIYADVLGKPIVVHPSRQGPALGAAILGVVAAGKSASGFASASAAIKAMAEASPTHADPARRPRVVKPDRKRHRQYQSIYDRYRDLADQLRDGPRAR